MTGLTATEAAARILAEVRRPPALWVPLDDALGSVLAVSVVTPVFLGTVVGAVIRAVLALVFALGKSCMLCYR